MNILTFATNEALDEAAAHLVIAALHTNPHAVLGLATGSTPIGVYKYLVKAHKEGKVSFKNATSFNLDEYIGLPQTHEESYYNFMQRNLFAHIDLPTDRANLPNANAADPHLECQQYEDKIAAAKGIDLQILGLGHNGHVGFNEPADHLSNRTYVVDLHEKTRASNARFFNSIEEVPTQAMTMGIGSILRARQILLIVRGEDKADIVHRALTGPITTQCPASLLQTHRNLVVMLDAAAGKRFAND